MKIDDVSLTIFTWDGIPATRYHLGALASSTSNLGLLRIHTDEGLEGHAFLGAATNPASMDGPQLIRTLKPMLMGQNPLERERLHGAMRLVSRIVSYRTIGAVDTALWDLCGKIAKLPVHALMGTCRTSIVALCQLAGAARHRRLCRSGADLQGEWLARLQDPSAARSRPGHQGVRGGAQGGRRRLPPDARFHLELQLHRCAACRPRDRGAGLLLVRRSDVR